ncbi:MAG: hypothetical protein PHE16_00630 [Aliarcobacter sp.]|nr:hypothetical protein [Aliarcobacter sp.]
MLISNLLKDNNDFKSWMKEFEKIVTSKERTFILICVLVNRTRAKRNFDL